MVKATIRDAQVWVYLDKAGALPEAEPLSEVIWQDGFATPELCDLVGHLELAGLQMWLRVSIGPTQVCLLASDTNRR